jgi:hypothetical protein
VKGAGQKSDQRAGLNATFTCAVLGRVVVDFFKPAEDRMRAFFLLARAPLEAERLLEVVEKEICKDEPVLAPEYRIAHGHDAIAVIDN